MLPASRALSRVLPFAQWVTYMISLGHTGYTAYNWYMRYREEMDRASRNGMRRSDEDVINQIVVKPRRRNRPQVETPEEQQTNSNPSSQSTYPQLSSIDPEGFAQLQERNGAITRSEDSLDDRTIALPWYPNSTNSDEEPQPGTSTGIEANHPNQIFNYDIDETLSTTSTSIESTDTSKGIINDMYSECFICANSLNNPGKEVARLPHCAHEFHLSCIDSVLRWHRQCPICSYHIFSPI